MTRRRSPPISNVFRVSTDVAALLSVDED